MSVERTTPSKRPMTRAILGTRGCLLLMRAAQKPELFNLPAVMAYARQLERAVDPDARLGAEELFVFFAELRQGAKDWSERWDDGRVETAKASKSPTPASLASPPWSHLTVAQVAERLGLSEQWIRKLCDDTESVLSATRTGKRGRWRIDPESVAIYEATRSLE